MQNTQIERIKRWYRRGIKRENDAFDSFFFLWVALVIASATWSTEHVGFNSRGSRDDKKIKQYLRYKKDLILNYIRNEDDVKALAKRDASNGEHIVDLRTPQGRADSTDRNAIDRFSAYYRCNRGLPDDELIGSLVTILYRVRNNLFHGGKIYDEDSDRKLLELTNPIMRSILEFCEPDIVGSSS